MDNKKYHLVGITGEKFNGKDTIADYLCKKFGYCKYAFANPLKDICKIIFDLSDEQLHGNLKEVPDKRWFNLTPRQILQFVGTDLFRNNMSKLHPSFGNDIWIIVAKNKLKQLLVSNPDTLIIISDVRFENEVNLIKEFNGIVCRVKRPIKLTDNKKDLHESETGISNFTVDYEFINDGTKEELYEKLDECF
jgi:hypothetical protein